MCGTNGVGGSSFNSAAMQMQMTSPAAAPTQNGATPGKFDIADPKAAATTAATAVAGASGGGASDAAVGATALGNPDLLQSLSQVVATMAALVQQLQASATGGASGGGATPAKGDPAPSKLATDPAVSKLDPAPAKAIAAGASTTSAGGPVAATDPSALAAQATEIQQVIQQVLQQLRQLGGDTAPQPGAPSDAGYPSATATTAGGPVLASSSDGWASAAGGPAGGTWAPAPVATAGYPVAGGGAWGYNPAQGNGWGTNPAQGGWGTNPAQDFGGALGLDPAQTYGGGAYGGGAIAQPAGPSAETTLHDGALASDLVDALRGGKLTDVQSTTTRALLGHLEDMRDTGSSAGGQLVDLEAARNLLPLDDVGKAKVDALVRQAVQLRQDEAAGNPPDDASLLALRVKSILAVGKLDDAQKTTLEGLSTKLDAAAADAKRYGVPSQLDLQASDAALRAALGRTASSESLLGLAGFDPSTATTGGGATTTATDTSTATSTSTSTAT